MNIITRKFTDLIADIPCLMDFFEAHELSTPDMGTTPELYFRSLPPDFYEEHAVNQSDMFESFIDFAGQLADFIVSDGKVNRLEILGGSDKDGTPENINITLVPGDVLSIVGPTGAGKSRLLEDIECLAQGDTPTGRHILVNGSRPGDAQRFNVDNRLVAQLSQNMNFVVDLCVEDFLRMHAESRLIESPEDIVKHIFEVANELAGEQFEPSTSVTSLSGGQSRALMIADTACLSRSPVVLIDEIENAGVDRYKALELLIREEKIVLLVTHDPELALFASRRLVIRNGGIKMMIERSKNESKTLERLRAYSSTLANLRADMRQGGELLFETD